MSATRGRKILMLAALALGGLAAAAQRTTSQAAAISRELEEIYSVDQADRKNGLGPDAAARDVARKKRVLEIVRGELLQTADDYYHAAMVLQHGDGPQDYLLAHILATAAAFKGQKEGPWLSAAALDRYLQSINRPQVFGSQYRKDGDGPWKQDPFDRGLVTDAIRKEYNARLLAEQRTKLEELQRTAPEKK